MSTSTLATRPSDLRPQVTGAPSSQTPIDSVTLREAAGNDAVRAFYAKANWQPLWSAEAIAALDQALAARDRHGLDRIQFLQVAPGATPAEKEVAHTKAALDYAAALARGVTDPASLHQVYTLGRPNPDLAAALAKALSENRLAAWLDTLAPQDDEYRQLSAAYLRYSREAATVRNKEIAPAGLIRPGDRSPGIPAIVAQLVDTGYLLHPVEGSGTTTPDARVSDAQRDSSVYTAQAAHAVRQLQRDYGIAVDGVIGPDTLKVLNLGPGDRARALAVALERRRWLSRDPAATRIDVNIAAARLFYYRDGAQVDSRKVIVGQPGKETPQLGSPIYRLVANPTWTVPKSIQNGELAHVGPEYLSSHNMVMRDGWIVQQSGPDNALGMVKFDMQNDQAIYLHDTSAPELFERSQRQLSHGCVRVEDALGFAERLAEEEGVSEQWQTAQASGEQTFVPLPRRIPVRLLYHNVFVDDSGQVSFRTDPYGWNDAVAQGLGFGAGGRRAANVQGGDIGP